MISVRLSLDNAVFTASEMVVDIAAETALTSKETEAELLIAGWGMGGSVAVNSEIYACLERVWRPILDGWPVLGGMTYR